MRVLIPSLTAALAFGCFSGAAAQTAWTGADASRTASVRYDDLDLSSPAGVATLKGRIALAARSVCGPEPDFRDLKNRGEFRACVTRATNAAGPASTEAIMAARARTLLAAASIATK